MWPNGAFAGNYEQSVVPALQAQHLKWPADGSFSVEVLGTLTLPPEAGATSWLLLDCAAEGGSHFLWIDDHLIY